MAAADESAADVRAIRVLLRAKTATGLLPFFRRLTWAPQNPTTRPPNTAENRLLIGHDASDGAMVYAHYLTTVLGNKVVAYYKDGSLKELYRYALDTSVLEVPFRYLMELQLTNHSDKHNLVGAYLKASFSLKGVTRDIAYEPTGSFESILGRAIAALDVQAAGVDGINSTAGDRLQTRSAVSSALPLTSASTSSNHPPPANTSTRRRKHSSSSSSQASEENTIDFDEDDNYPWRRTLTSDAIRTGIISQFGMFSPAKPRNLPQQDGIAIRSISSQSVNAATKRKPLCMLSDAPLAKHVNMGSGGRNRVNGESSAHNTAGTYPVDPDPMEDDKGSIIKDHPMAVESYPETGKATSLAIGLNSGLGRPARESSNTLSLSSPPSSPMDDENGPEGLISRNRNETIVTRNEMESIDLNKQAQDYLDLEKFIDHSGARISILEKKVQNHISNQTTSEEFSQGLEKKASSIQKQFEEEGITRREEIRKRLEAQMAVEMAANDEDIGKKIALGTAKIHGGLYPQGPSKSHSTCGTTRRKRSGRNSAL